jgi:hypothetical protein
MAIFLRILCDFLWPTIDFWIAFSDRHSIVDNVLDPARYRRCSDPFQLGDPLISGLKRNPIV